VQLLQVRGARVLGADLVAEGRIDLPIAAT
jgi:hypothetical protein